MVLGSDTYSLRGGNVTSFYDFCQLKFSKEREILSALELDGGVLYCQRALTFPYCKGETLHIGSKSIHPEKIDTDLSIL